MTTYVAQIVYELDQCATRAKQLRWGYRPTVADLRWVAEVMKVQYRPWRHPTLEEWRQAGVDDPPREVVGPEIPQTA